jgi:hypothetical protein
VQIILRTVLFFVCLILSTNCFSQDADSSAKESKVIFHDEEAEDKDSYALPDSTDVTSREPNAETLQRLQSDPSLQYKQPPTIAESLWDRFLLLISQFFESLLDNAVSTNWGQVLVYITGIVLVVVLVMMLLKVNAFKVFYSGEGAGTLQYNTLDENIHEMDFDKLIEEAMSKKDYRLGIRLVFLYALKMLSDKNHIHWDQGKTNHDYLDELKLAELKEGFTDLNYYFEYAWYGNFNINAEMFHHVQDIFKSWRTNIK